MEADGLARDQVTEGAKAFLITRPDMLLFYINEGGGRFCARHDIAFTLLCRFHLEWRVRRTGADVAVFGARMLLATSK